MAPARARLLSFGEPLHYLERTDSTQAIARGLAEQGAPEGAVVVAGEQTAGRGRLGNSFFSPPGGLYLSLVLRPSLPPAQTPLIALALGLAAAAAIRVTTTLAPILKWPNDVLIGRRKVCGVLVELAPSGAIAGIGLNANVGQFPADLRTTATSLELELGHEVDLEHLRDELLAGFERRYRDLHTHGASAVVRGWRAAPNMLGQIVRVSAANERLEGVAEDVDADGALLLRLPDGNRRRLLAGEVHLL